jgi:negative regulator of sigma E activity
MAKDGIMNNENLKLDLHHTDPSQCEIFEPLISAMLDGELTETEQNELLAHLDECSTCRAQVQAFQNVDQAVSSMNSTAIAYEESLEKTKSTDRLSNGKLSVDRSIVAHPSTWSWWRVIPLAVAASLLAILSITIINGPTPAKADQVTPEQIVKPMKELHLINLQQQRDQELMLRTLGMDLRSLKIEIAQLEPGSPERKLLTEQVEAMIEKVRLFESTSE